MLHEKSIDNKKGRIILTVEQTKIKLKGHESFYIREGWLRKGMKSINNDSKFFANEFATDILGVGSNMVKSIRYWLQACGLTIEKIVEGGKREQTFTEDFGKIIFEKDPYFEDVFSLWLIHYKLSTNKELSTTWYLFFNNFNVEEVSKEGFYEGMSASLNRLINNRDFAEKSLHDDCNCIIKTYCLDKNEDRNPEENTICPLTELGLLEKYKSNNGREYLIKKRPSMDKLDKLVVLYIILDNLKGNDSTSIDKILNDECNVGKVLNMDRNMLNEYLDALKNEGYIEINRTAGLDRIYLKNTSKEEVIEAYYEQL